MHSGCMKTKRLSQLIAIAACNAMLPVSGDSTITIQVTPSGYFRSNDGRPEKVPAWFIDAAVASRVISAFNNKSTDVVIDYEHQTLHKETNGKEAPAAAWYRSLEWREGEGLFATVELTSRARDAIAAKEYRYFSPVFSYDAQTGEVKDILMGALTNTPAVDGMDELTLQAAACFQFTTQEDDPVNKLLALIISSLALDANTTEDQAVAALTAHLAKDPLAPVRKTLGVADDADEAAVIAACTSLKTKNPDPANYVPVAVVQGLQQEIVALNERFKNADKQNLDALIKSAVESGQIVGKGMEDWARELGEKDIAALHRFLGTTQPFVALSKSQTNGKPRTDEKTGLTEDELAVCTRMGLKPEDYKANKEA